MNLLPFRIAFALIFALNFIIMARYRSQAQQGRSFSYEQEGRALAVALRVAGFTVWLYAVVYIVAPGLLEWSVIDLPAWLRWLGAAVALLAVPPLAIWAQRALGRNVSTTVITHEDHELITTGPYRYVRHPLYTIGFLFFSSLALLAASWFLAVAIVVVFILLALRTPTEERMLRRHFGAAYEGYSRRTGRYLPRLSWGNQD
ncbi:MAG: isoprenylcysteine carboxylmethyltransferase family protein [Candidatus Promineifilaceae bacterium]|nr:isoprenylcysteine carboxylmethyltransferase family protein [Candidatus Promineifilaceae bacterium]